jgi:hypothetical protein
MDQPSFNREAAVHVHSHVFTYENRKKMGSAGEIASYRMKTWSTHSFVAILKI